MKNVYFKGSGPRDRNLPFFLYGVGSGYEQEPIDRSGCEWYQLVLVDGGRGSAELGPAREVLLPGKGVFLYPNVPHRYHGEAGPLITSWIAFGGYAVDGLLAKFGFHESGVYSFEHADELRRIVSSGLALANEYPLEAEYDGSRLVYEYLLAMGKNVRGIDSAFASRSSRRLAPVLAYMRDRLAEDIALEDLASLIDVTPQHLCQLFRDSVRERPVAYLNRMRIAKAKNDLVNAPGRPIKEIASACGFRDMSYFGSMFRRQEGMTPGEFRAQFR